LAVFWLVLTAFLWRLNFVNFEKIIGHFGVFRQPDFVNLILSDFVNHI